MTETGGSVRPVPSASVGMASRDMEDENESDAESSSSSPTESSSSANSSGNEANEGGGGKVPTKKVKKKKGGLFKKKDKKKKEEKKKDRRDTIKQEGQTTEGALKMEVDTEKTDKETQESSMQINENDADSPPKPTGKTTSATTKGSEDDEERGEENDDYGSGDSGKNGPREGNKQHDLRVAHWIIKRPCLLIFVEMIVLILMMLVDAETFEMETSAQNHGYFINSDIRVHKMDALNLAKEYISDSGDARAQPRTGEIWYFLASLMVRKKNGESIINSDDMKYIVNIEKKILETDYDEYTRVCLATTGSFPSCSNNSYISPFSFVTDGTNDVSDQAIEYLINLSLSDSFLLSSYQERFAEERESTYYRSFFRFGLPYPDINATHSSFTDANHKWEAQAKFYDKWIMPIYEEVQFDDADDHKSQGLEVIFTSGWVLDQEFDRVIDDGMGFAFGSILIVWVLMTWHMRSLYLSTMGMIQIVLGFPFAYFLYRSVFQVTYFDTLSNMVIFVILGIGADDIFVFADAWSQSLVFVSDPDNLIERMSFSYERAAKAMLVTQITTFAAFMATAVSPLLPISAFGIWAALVVVCNYMLVISWFPAHLSFWYQNLKKYEDKVFDYCLCVCCRIASQRLAIIQEKRRTGEDSSQMSHVPDKSQVTGVSEADLRTGIHTPSDFKREMKNGRVMERFLGQKWSTFFIKYRYYVLGFYLGLFILSVSFASQIRGLTETEQWFDDDHFLQKAQDWPQKYYGGAIDALITENLVWGVHRRVDRSKRKTWDVKYYGDVKFDDDFDMSDPDAQSHLYGVCEDLRTTYSFDLYDTDDSDSFSCFLYAFERYAISQNLSFPVVFSDDADEQSEEFTEFVGKWVRETDEGNFYLSSREVGYVDSESRLKFVVFTFKLTEEYYVATAKKNKMYADWEDRIDEWNREAKDAGLDGVSRGFQTALFAWGWSASSEAFVFSAITGVAMALPIAFIVLVFSTQNWIVASFATSTIIGILALEVALMVWQGWQLGIGESVAVVMMIGFSVDYVVHLGNAYVECEFSSQRKWRIRFSLFTMGISVIMGALTTFGSGLFLSFPEMRFFKKFGILIMSTVAFSLMYALTYFISLLAWIGPSGDKGYVPVWWYMDKYVIVPCFGLCGQERTPIRKMSFSEAREDGGGGADDWSSSSASGKNDEREEEDDSSGDKTTTENETKPTTNNETAVEMTDVPAAAAAVAPKGTGNDLETAEVDGIGAHSEDEADTEGSLIKTIEETPQ